jgi:hypothetical protein
VLFLYIKRTVIPIHQSIKLLRGVALTNGAEISSSFQNRRWKKKKKTLVAMMCLTVAETLEMVKARVSSGPPIRKE